VAPSRRSKPATVRLAMAPRSWHGWASADERRGYGVNIHVDLLNEAIDDSDSVFAWKELAMSHCGRNWQ